MNEQREREIYSATQLFVGEWLNGLYDLGTLARKCARWADEHPKNPWISVEDRLPEKLNKFFSDFVLVMYTRGGKPYPFITRYDYEFGMWEIENVTHWMPIPELKKGGEV